MNFLIEPSNPLAISQNGGQTSGWGLLLKHSPKSLAQFLYDTTSEKEVLRKTEFLFAAEWLIEKIFHSQMSLSEDAKNESLKSSTIFLKTILAIETMFDDKFDLPKQVSAHSRVILIKFSQTFNQIF